MTEAMEKIYMSREVSWLDFNSRVLDEAAMPVNPLAERLKFIAIFSSNLDEFFMVRVAGLRQLAGVGSIPDAAGNLPGAQLQMIRRKLEKLLRRQYHILYDEILPGLEKAGIRLRNWSDLPQSAREELRDLFTREILPVLTPLAVDQAHPFPVLSNGAIEIAVSLRCRGEEERFAFVEVPEGLPRFVKVGDHKPGVCYIPLEEIIMANLEALFCGCVIDEHLPFRITRDMDFAIEDSDAEDLMLTIERKLLQRRSREPIRLEMPPFRRSRLARWLEQEFHLDAQFRYPVRGLLRQKGLFDLASRIREPHLVETPWPPLPCPELPADEPIFDAIAAREPVMLMLPFQSFDPVVRLLETAADDPAVLAIKQTLYRVSGNSPVVHALQRAAENGKQVTVIVELKARFDEGNNITWARRLEESGAHVVYGVSGLKIHCKALLIVRREDGLIRRYVHLSTGNYNDRTAALYTDIGFFSCDPELCSEVAGLFNVMTGYSLPPGDWRQIAAAPFNLRGRFIELIDREARFSTPHDPGHMIIKMNSLSDPEVIRHLYDAACKGVKIDLIVRGICCLKPGAAAQNIRIVSIVDRYLEHARIFYFKNAGMPEYFLSSADWMLRNLDRRIELLFPIRDPELRARLDRLLRIQLEDDDKARHMMANGTYTRPAGERHTPLRSQARTYEWMKKLSQDDAANDGLLSVCKQHGV